MSKTDLDIDQTAVTNVSESFTSRISTLIGQTIDGKYMLIERIGSGGMGVVFKAKHAFMDRLVAVKVLHPHLIENEEFLKRFRHEAQVTSKLRHNNAIILYDFGVYHDLPYLVMEFIQGATLKNLIQSKGPISAKRLFEILKQACAALGEAHALGIIHRDLKPDNIIISEAAGKELIQVLDFGIAKIASASEKGGTIATQAGVFFGTPAYASPEQVLGKELDARSDIYSLGIILYEALSGKVPFESPSVMELLMKHINLNPPPLSVGALSKVISPAVEEVVLRCLEKDPDKRFQTVDELVSAFRAALEEGTGLQLTGSWKYAATALLVIIGIPAGYWLSLKEGPKEVVAPVEQQPEKEKQVTNLPQVVSQADTKASSETKADLLGPLLGLARSFTVPSSSSDSQSTSDFSFSGDADLQIEQLPDSKVAESNAATAVAEEDKRLQEVISKSTNFETASSNDDVAALAIEATPVATATPLDPKAAKKQAASFYSQADSLYRGRRYAQAIPLFQKSLELDPKQKKALLSLGICYQRQGDLESAYGQYQAALQFDATYPPTHFNLACYYALKGNSEAAIKSLQLAIRYEPAARRWASSEPDLDSIRDDPRFQQLVD